ncbi:MULTISPECIES: hypothetical protein [unclassified Paenibacillus]|uniref:hypothetical protein n=1 Tax=unclassified Paenibacillus TaxID=185978 RepID=UPI00089AD090|nr:MULTISPECIES: hypothetical protein [unclassified Paenibacillus]MCM3130983.1 hypothetical protein [Paenibacillus sp. MER 78]SDX04551.1 hypothetical protein SAMN05518848_104177 [Paenibacillus sp. PDC88]
MEVVRSNLAHKITRGDEQMIEAEYTFGKSKVLIDTSFLCKTKEEREQVDRQITMVGWSIVDELIKEGEAV